MQKKYPQSYETSSRIISGKSIAEKFIPEIAEAMGDKVNETKIEKICTNLVTVLDSFGIGGFLNVTPAEFESKLEKNHRGAGINNWIISKGLRLDNAPGIRIDFGFSKDFKLGGIRLTPSPEVESSVENIYIEFNDQEDEVLDDVSIVLKDPDQILSKANVLRIKRHTQPIVAYGIEILRKVDNFSRFITLDSYGGAVQGTSEVESLRRELKPLFANNTFEEVLSVMKYLGENVLVGIDSPLERIRDVIDSDMIQGFRRLLEEEMGISYDSMKDVMFEPVRFPNGKIYGYSCEFNRLDGKLIRIHIQDGGKGFSIHLLDSLGQNQEKKVGGVKIDGNITLSTWDNANGYRILPQ